MRAFLLGVIICLTATVASAQVPNAPSGLTVADTGQRMDLTWTLNGGAETYVQIERKNGALPFRAIWLQLPGTLKYWDYSVSPSTTYTYRIKACNASGCSTASSEVSDTIAAASTAVGSLSVPSTAFTDEVVLIDARASTNFCKRPQSDGSPSITVNYGDGFTAHMLASAHRYMAAGSYTVTLNGKNCSGVAATQVTAGITVTDIPTVTCPSANCQTLTDSGNAATNATNLQNAINTAKAANTTEQLIKLSGSWTTVINGPISLGVPTASKYITIWWDGVPLREEKRITPAQAADAPTITTITGTTTPGLNTGMTGTDPPSHHWRIIGLHLKKDVVLNNPADGGPGALFYLGLGGGVGGQDTFAKIPHHFIVDRVWFDGGTAAGDFIKDGIRLQGEYVSVINCYMAEFKRSSGADPSAISVSGGRGPIAAWNNYLVADGENYSENTAFAGRYADVSSPTNTSATLSNVTDLAVDDVISFEVDGDRGAPYTPTVLSISGNNITFTPIPKVPTTGTNKAQWAQSTSFHELRRNYHFKPFYWNINDPTWNGTSYVLKNLWEAKNGKYFVVDGNIFHNSWAHHQPFMLVLGSATAETEAASVLRDIQWTNNLHRNMLTGLAITGSKPSVGEGSAFYTDFYVGNNLWWQVGNSVEMSDGTQDPAGSLNDLIHFGAGEVFPGAAIYSRPQRAFWNHNTADNKDLNLFGVISGQPTPCDLTVGGGVLDFKWTNSINTDRGYGYRNSQTGDCTGGLADQSIPLSIYFGPLDSTTRGGNIINGDNGHTYPAMDTIDSSTWMTGVFENRATGDFRLKAAHVGNNAALDGTDVGADMGVIKTAIGAPSFNFLTDWNTIKVISGDWTGVAPTLVCKWSNAGSPCQ